MESLTVTSIRESLAARFKRSTFYWRWRGRITRYRRAWRYARDTMTEDDAQWITTDCRDVAGWHPLASLCNESVMELALDVYEDHPDLARLVAEACSRVGYKWDDHSESASAAADWAMEKVAEYADLENIELIKREGWTE